MYPLRLGRYNDNDVTRARLIVFDGGLFFFLFVCSMPVVCFYFQKCELVWRN